MPSAPRRRRRLLRIALPVLAAGAAAAAALHGLAGAPVPAAAARAAAPPDLLDVVRVGDGSVPLTGAAAPVFVVPLTAAGAAGTPLALPVAADGAQRPLTLGGTGFSAGSLARSGDGAYLTVAGFAVEPGAPGVVSSPSSAVPRVVARIAGDGAIDTSTTLADAFTGRNARGAVTDDGSRFWVAGPDGGVVLQELGHGGAPATVVATGLSVRVPRLAGGSLWLSAGPGGGIYRAAGTAAGGPAPAAGAAPAALVLVAAGDDVYGFELATLAAGPAPDTAYVADGSWLRKFAVSGDAWTLLGSIAWSAPLGHLAVRDEAGTARVYATDLAGTQVLALVDDAGPGRAPAGAFAEIATAPPNTAYRGIALAPLGQPATGFGSRPAAVIVQAPPASTTSRSAAFAWTPDQPGTRFECSFDGAPWAACSSPRTYNGLALGGHRLAVRAAGARGPLPVSAAWTVVPFTTPPATSLQAAPAAGLSSRQARFSWSADQPGARFECSLDGAPWAACSSPRTYNGLAPGGHALRVRAIGATGLVEGAPALQAWRVVP